MELAPELDEWIRQLIKIQIDLLTAQFEKDIMSEHQIIDKDINHGSIY